MLIPDTLKAQLIIMAIGLIVVMTAHRKEYKASPLSLLIAIGLIYAGIIAPAALNYFRHFAFGVEFAPRLNFFWSFLSYWLGLKWCDGNLPRFSVDWGKQLNKSLFTFGVYQGMASTFAFSRLLFLFMSPFGFVVTLLFPLGAIWPRRNVWQHRHHGPGLYNIE